MTSNKFISTIQLKYTCVVIWLLQFFFSFILLYFILFCFYFFLQAAYGFCPHHVSHFLGMDVHDTPLMPRNRKLQTGMVITVEPGNKNIRTFFYDKNIILFINVACDLKLGFSLVTFKQQG